MTAIPIIELIWAIIAGSNPYDAGLGDRATFLVVGLVLLAVILFAGLIAGMITLDLASKDMPQRALPNTLGTIAIVMAVASVPINGFILFWFGAY